MEKLPVFQLLISDDETDDNEVNFVSLVDRPAIQRDFLAFAERKLFAIQDEEQQIVTGPAMVPDEPIFRSDKNGKYYVVFSADTIGKIAYRFFKKGYQGNINIMHESGSVVADSVFFESWIVDREKGKQPLAGFEDMPDGTWFLTAKINNTDTWDKIKEGEYKGFSVEGLFNYKPIAEIDPEEALMLQIKELLDQVEE
ncbi:putative serine protease XkdF [Chitinophaga polysaccharea]|uniref:Putative serine protease XkdF n=1 Tax=Chitinophaga polysaccharea TaxID=1293035 RepID=A0A561PL62_9BACT|nr:XkdF-like putative serine protease domain-containing protein [Chitinophaga polysaccharea]TWF38851.1 putative serine protease XkdF [Chitinophaga polysaccharea]